MELSAGRMDDSSATWFDKRVKKNFCMCVPVCACVYMYVHVYSRVCMYFHVFVCEGEKGYRRITQTQAEIVEIVKTNKTSRLLLFPAPHTYMTVSLALPSLSPSVLYNCYVCCALVAAFWG